MKFNKNIVSLSITLTLITAFNTQAANRQFLNQSENLHTHMARSAQIKNVSPRTLVGLDEQNKLVKFKEYKIENGSTVVRYSQFYQGLEVIGDHTIINYDNKRMASNLSGAAVYNISDDLSTVSTKLNKRQFNQFLRTYQSKAKHLSKNTIIRNQTIKKVIWLDKNSIARVVFEVSYLVEGNKTSRPYLIFDANTGSLLLELDNLQHSEATGPGGNIKTGRYTYGNDEYKHLDVESTNNTCILENSKVKTINMNHGETETRAHTFGCPENTVKEINGAYSPLNDAHSFGTTVFDMYTNWLGEAPLSFKLIMRVHYQHNLQNAFWNGEAMTFGDGGDNFYPLTSLDVTSHEVSHGFTEQNSNLFYFGQSGGLNEAFSDMAGEAAKYYIYNKNDFLVGKDIFKQDGALRYMNNPTQDGRSIDHASDHHFGLDVHLSSGVYNKAFYNLATTQGWDTKKAFLVMARANKLYWSKFSTWKVAATGVMNAACDMGYNTDDVKIALEKVGVTARLSLFKRCKKSTPQINQEIHNINPSQRKWVRHIQKLPSGYNTLTVRLSGGTGNADLYIKYNQKALKKRFTCSSTKLGNQEVCRIDNPAAGDWHIGIRGSDTKNSGITMNISAY